MTELLVLEWYWLSFNFFINFMIESFDAACFFSEKNRAFIFPVVLYFMVSVFFFEVRVERFGLKASSDECSATSTNKKLIFELLFLDILSWIWRFYTISFELVLCKLNRIDFKKMFYFRSFLVFDFESLFRCLVLREVLNYFINCMHCFSCNQLNRSNRTLRNSLRQLCWLMRDVIKVSVLILLNWWRTGSSFWFLMDLWS